MSLFAAFFKCGRSLGDLIERRYETPFRCRRILEKICPRTYVLDRFDSMLTKPPMMHLSGLFRKEYND